MTIPATMLSLGATSPYGRALHALDPFVARTRLRFALGHPHVTLGSLMERIAAIHGDRPMVSERSMRGSGEALTLSFDDAALMVDRWAGWFSEQIERGDRVVLATPNGYGQFLATLAVARAGGIPAPVNPHMAPSEVAHVIADTDAALVVRSTAEIGASAGLGEDRSIGDDEIAALFYTSGTTGKPKGAALSHRGLVGQMGSFSLLPVEMLEPLSGGPIEALLALPVAHIMGFVSVISAAVAGIRVRSIPSFNPVVVLDEIETRRCSVFVGVPTMYRMLDAANAEDRDLKSIRVWVSGADVMPTALAEKFKAMGSSVKLPFLGYRGEALFVEGYGMVETGGGAMAKISPPFSSIGLGSSLGFAMPGYRFRVVDEGNKPVGFGVAGELQLRGPGVLRGYWGDAAASAGVMTDDGWLRTGDQVVRNPLGGFSFQGRSKNVLKVGGYSVYPPEIESIIEEHPSVVEAAVVGAPDDRLGEVPWAAVTLQPGSRVRPDTIRRWTEKRLAEYKTPRRVIVVAELPHTGTGKVQRDQVRQQLGLV